MNRPFWTQNTEKKEDEETHAGKNGHWPDRKYNQDPRWGIENSLKKKQSGTKKKSLGRNDQLPDTTTYSYCLILFDSLSFLSDSW